MAENIAIMTIIYTLVIVLLIVLIVLGIILTCYGFTKVLVNNEMDFAELIRIIGLFVIGFVFRPIRQNNYLMVKALNPKVLFEMLRNLKVRR